MVKCAGCGTLIADETPQTVDRDPCPECGSTRREIYMAASDELKIYEQIRVKQKRPGIKGHILDQVSGHDYTHATGTFSEKVRIVDKLNDYYYEKVVDPKTGKVLHECEEKLSEHYGCGSAKLQPHGFLHKHVAEAAYHFWLKEGRPDGRDRQHWEMAIEDLRRVAGGAIPRHQ